MTQFHIYDIQKNPDGLSFAEEMDLKGEILGRNPEILDLSRVSVTGQVRYEAGLYFLTYIASYTITMASSRSLEPVSWEEELPVEELFVADESRLSDQDLIDADMLLVVEGDSIVLEESVADNILLHLPAKVLSKEEEASEGLPQGENWTMMTQSQYETSLQEKKEASSPFAQLQGLFDQD